jgi:hypothetical protein
MEIPIRLRYNYGRSPGSRSCGTCPYHVTGSGYFFLLPCGGAVATLSALPARGDGKAVSGVISQYAAHGPLPFPGGGKLPEANRRDRLG